MSAYIKCAFDALMEDAIKADVWYVCLYEDIPFYGGPEEGGWWGTDRDVVAYQVFPSEELANEARDKVLKLAKELSEDSRRQYGDYCLETMEWLNARGLDADFFPEPDGESKFCVVVSQEAPKAKLGCRHYE
ncbi:MAG: hypothetical protein KGI50_05565 [Patescibacteria group bacterium]|nr:hypothetical protein [Patescibacteria group bacterium]MDE2438901.1 hypothetical protein [Patescibacteria group bacterium]